MPTTITFQADSLAANLQRLQRSKGVNNDTLAKRMKVSVHTIMLWRTQKVMPRYQNLISLANALDCTLDDLIRPKPEEPSLLPPTPSVSRRVTVHADGSINVYT